MPAKSERVALEFRTTANCQLATDNCPTTASQRSLASPTGTDTDTDTSSPLRQGAQGSNGLFHAGRPRMPATDPHAVAEALAVCREDASGCDGDPVLIDGAGGKFGGVQFSIQLDP